MSVPIKNIDDLRHEIYELKRLEREQSIAIGQRFNSFSAVMSTIYSLFPKKGGPDGKGSFFDQDLFGLISRFILPLTLNKTIFRNSNFIIKSLVGIVSQKASHFISEESVTNLCKKIKAFFDKDKKEKGTAISDEKGIPPLSETY